MDSDFIAESFCLKTICESHETITLCNYVIDAASIYLIKFIPCTQVKGQFHGGLGQMVKNCVLGISELVRFCCILKGRHFWKNKAQCFREVLNILKGKMKTLLNSRSNTYSLSWVWLGSVLEAFGFLCKFHEGKDHGLLASLPYLPRHHTPKTPPRPCLLLTVTIVRASI